MIKKFNNFLFEHIDQNKYFDDYRNEVLSLTHNMNILGNDIKNKWYSKLGQYFIDTMGMDFLLKNHQNLDKHLKTNKENIERYIGTLFLTSYLDEESLKKMFGEPIRHSEFGEGFSPRRKYYCCSYFVNIDGHILHISYDNRGTSIECEDKLEPIVVFDIMKKLVDMFKETVIE